MIGQWLAAHRPLVATATSGTVIAAVVATLAIVSTGFTAQKLDLGDGSVWVGNNSSQVVGRANPQVLELNTVVRSTGTDLSVVQAGDEVLLVDHTDATVSIVDPATSAAGESVALPPDQPQVFLTGTRRLLPPAAERIAELRRHAARHAEPRCRHGRSGRARRHPRCLLARARA